MCSSRGSRASMSLRWSRRVRIRFMEELVQPGRRRRAPGIAGGSRAAASLKRTAKTPVLVLSRALRLVHEWLALYLARLLIASLGAQCVGQQPPRLSLRAAITARERERLAAAALGLVRVALREPKPPELYPQQGIVRFDAQRPVERRRRPVKIAVGDQGSGLGNERLAGWREAILAWRRWRALRWRTWRGRSRIQRTRG